MQVEELHYSLIFNDHYLEKNSSTAKELVVSMDEVSLISLFLYRNIQQNDNIETSGNNVIAKKQERDSNVYVNPRVRGKELN